MKKSVLERTQASKDVYKIIKFTKLKEFKNGGEYQRSNIWKVAVLGGGLFLMFTAMSQ